MFPFDIANNKTRYNNERDNFELLKSKPHDCVVEYFGYDDESAGCGWLALEFACLAGMSDLKVYFDRRRMLTPKQRKCIARQMCLGIKDIHEVSLGHFDIKFSNYLVVGMCACGCGGPKIKIADLGDVCEDFSNFWLDGCGLPKIGAQSPEMTNAWKSGKSMKADVVQKLDRWSNIWTLAVLIFYVYQINPLNYKDNCLNLFGQTPCRDRKRVYFDRGDPTQAFHDDQRNFSSENITLKSGNMEYQHMQESMLKFNTTERPCIQACLDHPHLKNEPVEWEPNQWGCNNCNCWTTLPCFISHCRACGKSCCRKCCIPRRVTDGSAPLQLPIRLVMEEVKLCKNCAVAGSKFIARKNALENWRIRWFYDNGTAKTFEEVEAEEPGTKWWWKVDTQVE